MPKSQILTGFRGFRFFVGPDSNRALCNSSLHTDLTLGVAAYTQTDSTAGSTKPWVESRATV